MLLLAYLVVGMGVPLFSQTVTDTAYVFRFKPGDEAFDITYGGNDTTLYKLLSVLSSHMEQLKKGDSHIRVSSYGASSDNGSYSAAMSRLHSLSVRSELIDRGEINESMLKNDRHITSLYNGELGDVVVVTLPARGGQMEHTVDLKTAGDTTYVEPQKTMLVDAVVVGASLQNDSASTDQQPVQPQKQDSLPSETKSKSVFSDFALRANLLRWATLSPDLGVEVRVNRNVGVSVDATYTVWTWNDNDGRYALWQVAPEVRYYLGEEKRGYLGVMYKVGSFDYKLSYEGKQGDLMGGGITGGYRMRLNHVLDLNFSLGLGYVYADYEKYVTIDGVRVSRGCETKGWWGPVHAGVTLIWTLF